MAAQRITIHRGAIECGNVQPRNNVAGEHAIRGRFQRNVLGGQARRAAVDPFPDGGNFAAPLKALHPDVDPSHHAPILVERRIAARRKPRRRI